MVATVEDQLFTVMKLLFLDTLKLFKKGIFDTFNTRTFQRVLSESITMWYKIRTKTVKPGRE